MALLKRIKSIDQKTKDLVLGWIREVEEQVKSRNISLMVSYVCLAHYYIPEYFDKARQDSFMISEDKRRITSITNWESEEHTIYMKHWIHSMSNKIAKWTFKINQKRGFLD